MGGLGGVGTLAGITGDSEAGMGRVVVFVVVVVIVVVLVPEWLHNGSRRRRLQL